MGLAITGILWVLGCIALLTLHLMLVFDLIYSDSLIVRFVEILQNVGINAAVLIAILAIPGIYLLLALFVPHDMEQEEIARAQAQGFLTEEG